MSGRAYKASGRRGLSRDNHSMTQSIGQVAIVVRDYDEALTFYVDFPCSLLLWDANFSQAGGQMLLHKVKNAEVPE